jgi:hypothetical protein
VINAGDGIRYSKAIAGRWGRCSTYSQCC